MDKEVDKEVDEEVDEKVFSLKVVMKEKYFNFSTRQQSQPLMSQFQR